MIDPPQLHQHLFHYLHLLQLLLLMNLLLKKLYLLHHRLQQLKYHLLQLH